MQKRYLLLPVAAVLPVACAGAPRASAPAAKMGEPAAAAPLAGIDMHDFDMDVRPQDDLYLHVNGGWLRRTEIPADKARIGTFTSVQEQTIARLRAIAEDAGPTGDPTDQKVRDFYASYMDEDRIEAIGLAPLAAKLARLDTIRDRRELALAIGALVRESATVPIRLGVHVDTKDATRYLLDIGQSGLGLDRDYYIRDDDSALKETRAKYRRHVEKMLSLAGDKSSAADADAVIALETEIAKIQWTALELRDAEKGYNKTPIAKLSELAPGFDWTAFFRASGVAERVGAVNVAQPSYVAGCAKLFATAPLPRWRAYLKWHVLSDRARALPKTIADEQSAFYDGVLQGTSAQAPRWQRALFVVEGALGEQLGKRYVEKHFAGDAKPRLLALVKNILAAFDESIAALDWMSDATKREAKAKLAKIAIKIGYPDRFRDYSGLEIVREDLFGNMVRADVFEVERSLAHLGTTIDRAEWTVPAHSVDAFYNPERNEIVFPAGILQPPLFDPTVDDATNYGGIGAVIGHEISHGFDDQGSRYDGDGNLRDWWTREDRERYAARTKALVDQYSAFEVLPGYRLNGELTLGESIADNSGLSIAHRAYVRSLHGKAAPALGGLTGDQRFFISFARIWRSKQRDSYAIARIKGDPHPDEPHRVLGSIVNQPAFYTAFGVKPGDKLYVSPDKHISIW